MVVIRATDRPDDISSVEAEAPVSAISYALQSQSLPVRRGTKHPSYGERRAAGASCRVGSLDSAQCYTKKLSLFVSMPLTYSGEQIFSILRLGCPWVRPLQAPTNMKIFCGDTISNYNRLAINNPRSINNRILFDTLAIIPPVTKC